MPSTYTILLALIIMIFPYDLSANNAAKEIGCNYRCFESEKAGQGEKLNERVGEAVCRKRVYNEYGFGHSGSIKEVADGGVIVEKKDGIEAVSLKFITRIRKWSAIQWLKRDRSLVDNQ